MAVRGYFYNAKDINDKERMYNGEDMNEDKAPFYKEGVAYGQLGVTAGEGMTIKVDGGSRTGYAYINLHTIHNTAVLELTVSQANGTLPRIDRVILRNDETERKPSIFILEGEYSSNPQPPALTNTAAIQEKCLAEIYVAAGAVKITQADIKDTRADNSVCGFIASQFVDIDFSQFELQFASWAEQEQKTRKEEFDKLFSLMRDQLSEDAAVRLQLLIGNTDISNIGDGTLTSAISSLDEKSSGLSFVKCTQAEYDALGSGRPSSTVYIIVG